VRSVEKKGLFEVETSCGTIVCQSLVVATGGLSIPPLGATDFVYRLARQFGLRILEPWPALLPFTLSREALRELSPLSGVSIDGLVSCQGAQFRENILITHRGLTDQRSCKSLPIGAPAQASELIYCRTTRR